MSHKPNPARTLLRERTRANQAAARARRAPARAARRITSAPRTLRTHLIAAGVPQTVQDGVLNAARTTARRIGVPATVSRRRIKTGGRRLVVTVKRFTAAQVELIMQAYAPRKAEYKTARALVLGLAA